MKNPQLPMTYQEYRYVTTSLIAEADGRVVHKNYLRYREIWDFNHPKRVTGSIEKLVKFFQK